MWFKSTHLNRSGIRGEESISYKRKIAELSKMESLLLKNCHTIVDLEDYLIARWLYEECLKGDKDACRILKEGCKWENTGENWLMDIGD